MKEKTIGFWIVNLISILSGIILFVIISFSYMYILNDSMETSSLIFYPRIFLPSVIIAIIIHELIHGICFAQFAKGGIKSVHFGVKWKYLTPYCHCSESVNVQQYRIALVMPSVVLGFIPSVSGFIIHNFTIVMLGCTLIAAGIGDFIILWMLRNLPQNTRVVDHPDKIGFLYEDIQ